MEEFSGPRYVFGWWYIFELISIRRWFGGQLRISGLFSEINMPIKVKQLCEEYSLPISISKTYVIALSGNETIKTKTVL